MSDKNRILLNLFIPQRRRPAAKHAIPAADRNLAGRTAVVSGATDGIGRGAVEMLAAMGANIVLLGRNEAKATAVIEALGGPGTAMFEPCDFASMDSVKRCAERILAGPNNIDILVNCAGVNSVGKTFGEDGYETNWTINYLGPVLLTRLLLDRIKQSAPARIVNVTTNVDFLEQLDIDKIRARPQLNTSTPYAESKLALNMFTIDLANETSGTGVTVNCLHPGNIQSNLLREMDQGSAARMRKVMQLMASPTKVGADRVVRLAVSSEYEGVSGAFVIEDDRKPQHSEAQDPQKRAFIAGMTNDVLARWL